MEHVHTLPGGGSYVIPNVSALSLPQKKQTSYTTYVLLAVISAIIGATVVIAVQKNYVPACLQKKEVGPAVQVVKRVAQKTVPPGSGTNWTPIEDLVENEPA